MLELLHAGAPSPDTGQLVDLRRLTIKRGLGAISRRQHAVASGASTFFGGSPAIVRGPGAIVRRLAAVMRRVCAVHGPHVTHPLIGPFRRFMIAGGLVLLGGDPVAVGGRLIALGSGLVTVRGHLVGVGSALVLVGDHLIRGKQHNALDAALPLSEGTVWRIRISGLIVCILHPLASEAQ
ncbi:MAG: hypothetical protein ABSH36_00330 [Solirubrobacteraceae bacterium]